MNLRKSLLFAAALLLSGSWAIAQQPFSYAYNPEDENLDESCTSIMVGKDASTDGSVMTAHSCDSNNRTWLTMEKRKQYKPGEKEPVYVGLLHTEEPDDMRKVTVKGYIPAPEQTYRFLNTAYPCMNEKQLAIGETTTVGKGSLRNPDGLFQIEELQRLALQRCTTARDAIRLMGSLAEEFGYGDSGECLTIADKNEVWHFEIYGTGKVKQDGTKKGKKAKASPYDKPGALWVAQRIPDDHVGVSANIPRIGVVDFDNPDYFMYASDLKERTQHMGLWDGKSEFKFYKMVSNGKPFSIREYYVLNKLAPSLGLKYDADEIPFSVKPEHKVSPEEMFAFYRETYEGTEYDVTKNLMVEVARRKRDAQGNVVEYKDTLKPVSPFMSGDLRSLLNQLKPNSVPRARAIAVIQCSYSHVIQLRNWLPDEIGGVCYFSFDNPAQSPRIPIYCGETQLPKGFDVCGQHRYREDAAIWKFRKTNRLATAANYSKTRPLIDEHVAEYEKAMMEGNKIVEEKASALLKEGKKEEAVQLLNTYTSKFAENAGATWEDLMEQMWMYFVRSM